MTFTELMQAQTGYTPFTTFWTDFSIADRFGVRGVKDTFRRAFNEWKGNYRYLTELVLVLNTKCCDHYNRGNERFSELYSELYDKAAIYAEEHLAGDEYKYYFDLTD